MTINTSTNSNESSHQNQATVTTLNTNSTTEKEKSKEKGQDEIYQTELHWYRTVYQGDHVPQLTVRAVVMGMFLGGFMSLSNLYVGLKTGWGLGVAITACILSFTIYKTLMTIFPNFFKTEMSILENNCMQSTASSAGYSTGGTMVSAIAAYLIITGNHIPWPTLALWTFFLATLGVFLAIPMKRQMINREQLKFPSGIAAAETLKSLHSKGGDAIIKARALGFGSLFGALIAWFRDGGKPFAIPGMLPLPGTINGIPFVKWTLSFEMSAIMIAAGAIMGWKISWSLLLGGAINYGILAPKMVELGAIDASKLGYRAIVSWSTWGGAAIMVASGLLTFFLQWSVIKRSIVNFISGLSKSSLSSSKSSTFADKISDSKLDPLKRIEVPPLWFATGAILSGAGCMALLYFAFHTSFVMGVIAVAMTFFLALVACRATGESDITPIGAMGKITQLAFGVLAPTNIITNLMTASVTSGAAASSADLLTDLKSGYLLGANPRRQFIAQFLGVFAGVLVVVPAFYLLVPDASMLGSDKWPAPAAQVWAAVAKLLAQGLQALHPTAQIAILIGSIVGIILTLIERNAPEKIRPFIPSCMGIGLAMVIPFFNSLSMFIGALIALVLTKKAPVAAERFIIPVSSGIIAGESILGVIIALLGATGIL
ncbi:MAG: OPT/YSL family transporter [Oligoflexia bacterium]|nr:OPT/YSL family transporter [Oligoflexia bacterium]